MLFERLAIGPGRGEPLLRCRIGASCASMRISIDEILDGIQCDERVVDSLNLAICVAGTAPDEFLGREAAFVSAACDRIRTSKCGAVRGMAVSLLEEMADVPSLRGYVVNDEVLTVGLQAIGDEKTAWIATELLRHFDIPLGCQSTVVESMQRLLSSDDPLNWRHALRCLRFCPDLRLAAASALLDWLSSHEPSDWFRGEIEAAYRSLTSD